MRRRVRVRRRLMRRALLAIGGTVAVTAMVAAPAGAAGEDLDIVAVDSASHPTVTLTVEPPDALAATDLAAENFTVTENGTTIDVSVERAAASTGAAREVLEVVLVVDASGSMQGEPLAAAKEAARTFLAQMPDGTHAASVVFGDAPAVVASLTDDVEEVGAALAPIEATGETSLYDALVVALGQFSGQEGTRQALVVLSDGGDTASQSTLETATAALADAGAEFAAVELVTSEYDGTALRTLADAAGGAVLSVDDPGQLASLYSDVAADLLNRYAVTYTSATGGQATIDLSVASGSLEFSTQRAITLPGSGPLTVSAPDASVVEGPGWLGSNGALYLALGLLFSLFAAALAWTFLRPRDQRVSLSQRSGSFTRMPAFAQVAERASEVAQRRLEKSGRDSALYAALERAGVALRPGEFVVLVAGAAVVAAGVGLLFGGMLFGLVLAAVIAAIGPTVVKVLGRRRCRKFAEQLADTLQLITGNLRAGHSILQAIDSVADDAPSPTREEFERVVVEVRLGRDLGDALRAMHTRIGGDDFEWFVQALQIHQEVGGDLAEILDTVAGTIRERGRLRRHVQALSAEGKLSAIILYVLPFAVMALFSVLNPTYMAELFSTFVGRVMLFGAGVFMTGGFFWLRKVVRLEF